MSKSQINLKIFNNTSFSQGISLFNIVNNPNSASQTQTEYVFDLTGHTFLDTTWAVTSVDPFGMPTIINGTYSGGISGLIIELNINIISGVWRNEGDFIYFNSNTFAPTSLVVD